MRQKAFITWVLLILLSLLSLSLAAKKVVCIAPDVPPPADADPNDNVSINIAEGYQRSISDSTAHIQKCTNLADLKACMNQLVNGDSLVIIAHGIKGEKGFYWGEATIKNTAQLDPNPAWLNLTGIHVHVAMCYSTKNHSDGNTLNDIIKPMFGQNTGYKGYEEIIWSSACLKITCTDPLLNESQRDAIALLAYMLLEKGQFNWMLYPPPNRPNVGLSMQEEAQNYINARLFPYQISIEVFYKKPYEAKAANLGSAMINGRIIYGKDIPGEAGNWAEWLIQNRVTLLWFFIPEEFLPPGGGWSSGGWFTDYFLAEAIQPVRIRNIRFTGFENQVLLPEPGLEEFVSNPVSGFFDISYDEGHSYTTVEAEGVLDLAISEIEAGDVVDTSVFVMMPTLFHLQGLPPHDDLMISMDPILEPRGYGAIATTDEGTQVACGLTLPLQFTKLGFAPVTSPMPVHITLNCLTPVAGCMDPEAMNYNICAFEDDGSCIDPVVGCTYPDATNYHEGANIDDGSCEFEIASCPGDFNDDNMVSTVDLLSFLSLYDTVCE
jgi:hypothetical protein